MALCDQLEAAKAEREKNRDRLVTASLQRLNKPTDDEEAFRTDTRFTFNHLPRITTRPAHIKQLRHTILNLAVRGKLVELNPNDESAAELLKRIQAENVGFVTKNKIRKLGIAPAVEEATEYLFKVPKSWEWTQWENILATGEGSFKRGPFGSALTKSIFVTSGYKVYEQYCPINDDCSFARYYITEQKFQELKGFAVKAKDFLISCSGSLGRITQVPDDYEEGVINQALLRVRINNKLVTNAFFNFLFRSPYFQDQILSNSMGTAIPNVKGVKELKAIPFPLPPFAEQYRIVAKVDELMALCDQLEAQLTVTQPHADRAY
jgi:type I restriction enzyme S subunit